MKFSFAIYAFILTFVVLRVDAVKKKLIDEVHLCKRNDPELMKCYCENFRKVTPLLKDGVPQMNIKPLDPAIVENIKMDFRQTQSIKMVANLINVQVSGLAKARAEVCQAYMTKDGIQLYFEMHMPEIGLKSTFTTKGNFLLLTIDATGDFHGEFSDIIIRTKWNSTRYSKRGKDHLTFTSVIENMSIDKLKIHFNNLFGNNTELNDNINLTINENIESLYGELNPIIMETINGFSLRIINDFYAAFPFDMLYPLE